MTEEKTKYKEMDNSQNRREINDSFDNKSNRAELAEKPRKDEDRDSN